MGQQRTAHLREQLAQRIGWFADKGSQELAASIRAAVAPGELAEKGEQTLFLVPRALEQLKLRMGENLERIDAAMEAKQRERGRIDRGSIDILLWRLDENMQTAADLLRRVLPDAALAPASIEFAEVMLLPIEKGLKTATDQSERVQEELFLQAASIAAEVLDGLQREAAVLLGEMAEVLGLATFHCPPISPYRAPEFFFIPFHGIVDGYEQFRVSSQGMGLLHAIRPRWFKNLLLRLPQVAGLQLGEIVGGMAGYDSLSDAKRVQLRRELSSIAAEHRRRILCAALEQASTCSREMKANVLVATRAYYAARFEEAAECLSQLVRERKKTLLYWRTAERMLLEAQTYAGELVSLTRSTDRKEAKCIA